MKLRVAPGWQYIMADLSLILFLTAAAGLTSDTGRGALEAALHEGAEAIAPASVPQADSWSEEADFGLWLEEREGDVREQLTIRAEYAPGVRATALARAEELAREAERRGLAVRMVLQPGGRTQVRAAFAFDAPAARQGVARDLQDR